MQPPAEQSSNHDRRGPEVTGPGVAPGKWPLERVLFALSGTVTLISALLTRTVSKRFVLLTAFVGANQWLYVVTGACPSSILLRRACHLRSMADQQPGTPQTGD